MHPAQTIIKATNNNHTFKRQHSALAGKLIALHTKHLKSFVMMFNNNRWMPNWQGYHLETVSGFRQAPNQNTELHDGDTAQERLQWLEWPVIFRVDYWQICPIWPPLNVVHDWIRISKLGCDSVCLWCELHEITGVGVFWKCDLSYYSWIYTNVNNENP